MQITYYPIQSGPDVLERKMNEILSHSRQSGLVVIDSLAALLGSARAFRPTPRSRLSSLAEGLT